MALAALAVGALPPPAELLVIASANLLDPLDARIADTHTMPGYFQARTGGSGCCTSKRAVELSK